MVFKGKIDPEKRAYIRLAMQFKGEKPAAIIKKLNISRASFYRILKGENGKKSTKGMATDKYTTGRLRKLSTRDERLLLQQIPVLRKSEGNFTVKRIMHSAGINLNTVSCRTVQRFLRRKGFYYLQARKKGILTEKDQYKRLQFARKVKTNYPCGLWTEKIAFYLDGVSFVHKYNPADQARAPKARSPDINPIENIFNIIKQILQKEALNKNITFETFEQFSRRVADTINTLDERLIDRTIESMSKRIDLIIEKNGARTKY